MILCLVGHFSCAESEAVGGDRICEGGRHSLCGEHMAEHGLYLVLGGWLHDELVFCLSILGYMYSTCGNFACNIFVVYTAGSHHLIPVRVCFVAM